MNSISVSFSENVDCKFPDSLNDSLVFKNLSKSLYTIDDLYKKLMAFVISEIEAEIRAVALIYITKFPKAILPIIYFFIETDYN